MKTMRWIEEVAMEDSVGDWMRTGIATVSPDSTLDAAIGCMESQGVTHVCVVEPGGQLVGILGKADVSRAMPGVLTDRYLTYAAALRTTAVKALMTRSPIVAAPEVPLVMAQALMEDCRIGALPVVDSGLLIGILTASDFLAERDGDVACLARAA
jgi:acetoin utilization protein AcuB